MAKIESIVSLVQSDVPNAPKAVIRAAVIRVVREFCRRTQLWLFQGRAYLPAGRNRTDMDLPNGAEPLELKTVYSGSKHYTLLSYVPFSDGACVSAVAVDASEGHELVFNGSPQKALQIDMRVVCQPDLDATNIPDHIAGPYAEGLASGAAEYLMLQNGRPWADLQLAQLFGNKFQIAVGQAKRQVAVGTSNSNPTVQLRRW